MVGRESRRRGSKRAMKSVTVLRSHRGRPLGAKGRTLRQPLERSVEVADHLVGNCHASIRIHGIHVDRQERHLADPGLILHLHDVVAEPHDEIGAAQELPLHLAPGPLDAAEGERVILRDHALGHGGRREGKPMAIDHRLEHVGVAEAHGRRADDRDRPARGPQDLGRAPQRSLRGGVPPPSHRSRRHVLGGRRQRDVLGQVQVNGSKGLAQGDLERLGEHRGDAALPKGQRGLRDRPEERVMIDRHLDAPPELRRRQIARDRQERRAIEVGIPDSGREVRGAGSQRRDAESRRARQSAHDVGHERR